MSEPADSSPDGRPAAIAIFGPTASGKSAVAEALAARLEGELVSADAMQAYQGVPILTNQPSTPAGLVAIWPLAHEGSVGEYATLAHRAIDRALEQGRVPVLAGGTGLYLRAALCDMALPPRVPAGLRERWERAYETLGPREAHDLLAARDAPAAAIVHPNDRRRVVRALELAEAGESLRPESDRLWSGKTRHPTLVFGLDLARERLRERIAARTRAMIERGAVEEARKACAGAVSRGARGIIGLRELTELPLEEAMAAIERRTLRYAAYQKKWMRRIPGIVTVQADRPPGVIAHEILEMARARERLPARRAG